MGHDFLSAFALSLNFSNSSLHLHSSPLTPLPSRPSLQQSTCFTVTVDKSFLVLPPRAETVFSAKISPNLSPGTIGLVNPEAQLLDKYFLSGAYHLATVSHDHTVPVRILNPHEHLFCSTLQLFWWLLAVDPVPLFGTADSSAPDTVVTDLPIDFCDPVLNDSGKEQLLSLLQNYSDIFSIIIAVSFLTSHILLILWFNLLVKINHLFGLNNASKPLILSNKHSFQHLFLLIPIFHYLLNYRLMQVILLFARYLLKNKITEK